MEPPGPAEWHSAFTDGDRVSAAGVPDVAARCGFSREQLLDAVWGQDRAITDRAVDVYILRLRQKTEADPANPSLIRSVRGFGYTFNESEIQNTEQSNGSVVTA